MNWRYFYQTLNSVSRFFLLSVFTFSMVFAWIVIDWNNPVQGQLPSLSTTASNNPFKPPKEVTRWGELEVAPVKSPLDNQVLFEIASFTVLNRDKVSEDKIPVEVRAEEITQRLWRVMSRTIQAKETPTVSIATLNNRLILQATDDQFSRPLRLITVTEPDADYYGKNLDELAQEWQKRLQAEVVRVKHIYSPEVLLERLEQCGQILLGIILSSIVIWFLRRILTRRQKTLEARYQQQLQTTANEEKTSLVADKPAESFEKEGAEARQIANLRAQFLAVMQEQFSVKRRLEFDKSLKWLLFWIFILIWYIGIYLMMSRLPILMRWSNYVLTTPLLLILVWFVISLAIRLSKTLIDRFIETWKVNPYLPLGEVQRIALRSTTISGALQGLSTFILSIVGIIWTLSLFNIPTSSLLAGSAILGLAISFGSQSLIKDLVNGCLILFEDQFAVGDVIQIGDKGGLVENLNLRITQLRNAEGQLITIPNSSITDVKNLTRLWSRVDFAIIVAYENDPEEVLAILKQVSKQLYSEPQWRDRLLEPPEVLGIDDLSHTGMLLRVWIKTRPMEQWSVGREFRLRVRQAFEANNIQIGRPQWTIYRGSKNAGGVL